jgi:hypothetical protein
MFLYLATMLTPQYTALSVLKSLQEDLSGVVGAVRANPRPTIKLHLTAPSMRASELEDARNARHGLFLRRPCSAGPARRNPR